MDLILILLILTGGIGLLILELVAIPGTTITGLLGCGLIVWGIYNMYVEYGVVWGTFSFIFCLACAIILLMWSLRAKTWKRFSLDKSIDSKVNELKKRIVTGDKGLTITRLAPVGIAEINGERIEVYTATSFVDPNTEIEVECVEGNKIMVKPINIINKNNN
ncbi:MAG: NfeD family protein [Bacteroidales bacterium]|jgi:membrane-bound ClpP family serine protease|nr:NfeD family protein [Bacteroidales bacterium]